MSRIALALLVALAGCLSSSAPPNDGHAPVEAVARDVSIADCPEGIAVFVREPAAYQALLPEGFRTRDAAALLKAPEATGQAAAFVNLIACARTDLQGGPWTGGETAILVEPPRLDPDPGLTPTDLDFYVLTTFSPEGGFADLLGSTGYPVASAEGEVRADASAPPAGTVAVDVRDDDGPLYAFSVRAAAAQEFSALLRLWSLTPTGPAFIEYDVRGVEMRSGLVESCEFREGSVLADLFDRTSCGPGEGTGLFFPAQTAKGTYRTFPGAKVGSVAAAQP